MTPSSDQQQRLQSELIILLTRIDEIIDYSLWEILGEGENGLWNLFHFKTFDDYFDFMVHCGFVHRTHKTTNHPYFVEKGF